MAFRQLRGQIAREGQSAPFLSLAVARVAVKQFVRAASHFYSVPIVNCRRRITIEIHSRSIALAFASYVSLEFFASSHFTLS